MDTFRLQLNVFRQVLCATLLSAAFFIGGSVEAQIFGGKGLFGRKEEAPRQLSQDEIGVPTPVTGRIEAIKGQEVRFEIQAESKTPAAAVEFLIRTFPSAGKIVSLTSNPNARNRAIVTYYADPNSSAESDAFAFAVRYRGGRYSSAMRFDIDLVDTDNSSEVVAETEADFGSVSVGREGVAEVLVQNMGGGVFNRQILVAPPWYVLDPKDGMLRLGPRQSRKVKLAFRPDMVGETSYFLSFSRSKRGTTKLVGTGMEPFTLEAERVELKLVEGEFRREGVIPIRNSGDRPLRINARGSTRLQKNLEEEYLLAPGKTTEIKVALTETDLAPLDGMVQFYLDNGYTQSVQVISPVVPGHIELSVPNSLSAEVINFGKVEAGRSTERGLVVHNRGGTPVPLEFHIPEPFRLLTNPGPELGPNSSVSVAIGLYPQRGAKGLVDVTMNVYGTDQNLPVRLLGNVTKASGPGAASTERAPSTGNALNRIRLRPGVPGETSNERGGAERSVDMPPERDDSVPAVGSGEGRLLATTEEPSISPQGWETYSYWLRERNPELKEPEDLSVLASGKDWVTIGWTAPRDSELCRFDVEVAGLAADIDQGLAPKNVWLPLSTVSYERIDRLVKARIEGLTPATAYELRVFTVDENGRSSFPSEAIEAETGLPMDWTYIYAALFAVGLILLALAVRKIVLDRRPEVYEAQYVDS